jgi:hypothetical protein
MRWNPWKDSRRLKKREWLGMKDLQLYAARRFRLLTVRLLTGFVRAFLETT